VRTLSEYRRQHVLVAEFDEIADHYDETRGGEPRGEEYAADIDAQLPVGEGPILEVGVGTGVVARGLQRRGRRVIGLDVSAPMLARARTRLGPVVVRSDALRMPIAIASVAHTVSVWVVHAVADPEQLFREVARVMKLGGRYVVCTTQRPAPNDEIGNIIAEMGAHVDQLRGSSRPRGVTMDEVLSWAARADFVGSVHRIERRWKSSPAEEMKAIAFRTWPALHELDEDAVELATRPAIDALKALPTQGVVRQGIAELVVFQRQ
jgi:ubiquinone/menaquinone biosynthesis C-methylase UbiE